MADPKLVRDWLFAAERGDLVTLKRLLTARPGLVDTLGQGPVLGRILPGVTLRRRSRPPADRPLAARPRGIRKTSGRRK